MAVKSLIYFEVVTTLALLIGWTAITFSGAGLGVNLPPMAATEQLQQPVQRTWQTIVLDIFPENIARSVADAQVLQIVVFSVLFGIGLAMVAEERRRPLLAFAESLAETMFKVTQIVMLMAPIGVGAAIAYTVGHLGLGVLVNLAKLLATFYVAVAAFVVLVLLPVALIARVPLRRFIAAVTEPVSIAFATTSSEAALPRAMEAMERLGVPRKIVAFVIPTGYSFNLDGSTLYLSLAAHLRHSGGGHPPDDVAAAGAAADADADEQGRRRCAARRAGHPARHARLVRAAGGAGVHHPRHRRADGHAAHVAERARQLPGDGGHREVGRGVRRHR